MSAADPNIVHLEVNGVPCEARKGQMIIEVTDRAEIYVPRFCYHRKLTIAANCRMCLVEVEKAPKPLPACATPVAEGMKVFTKSARAISAQKATMEFLLINHPLDCPICDQGGECELQDLAMGFGRGVSRYTEKKRIVKDKNIGPLVSTDMTRCIHCTRCVRFGAEIAGIQELGTLYRTENMQIGTYVEKSVDHELSGNIIDLCPVGALNNKPFRFGARAWEMVAKPSVAAHDCAGSNLYAHVLRGQLRRIVPRDNEDINETWLSDRDRFSCYGIYSADRLRVPLVKQNGQWAEVSWQDALVATRDALRSVTAEGGAALGVLASPSSTVEELYLLNRIARHLGSENIDHRLRRTDFRNQADAPVVPLLGGRIADLAARRGILVVGSNLRMEVPIIAHRLRQAARAGAQICFVNPAAYEYHFAATYLAAPLATFARALAGVVAAAARETGAALAPNVAAALNGIEPGDAERAAAKALIGREGALVLLGQIAQRHPRYAEIHALAAALAAVTGAQLGLLAEGANGVGAALAGAVPHRGPGGRRVAAPGLDVQAMLRNPRRGYVLFGIEPSHDLANGADARRALQAAEHVIAFTAYRTPELEAAATILLPIGTFAEVAGTFVNAEGRWQSFDAVADLVGEARPGWRVLRALGNELALPSCEYRSPSEVSAALQRELGMQPGDEFSTAAIGAPEAGAGREFRLDLEPVEIDVRDVDIPIYSVDAVVRRSLPLQETALAQRGSPP
jgi:NADH-quinone oxidoreductase subunit G